MTKYMRAMIMLAAIGLSQAVGAAPAVAACVGGWSAVASPNVGEPGGDLDNGLSSLAVVEPDDIWAVGNAGTYGEARSTLAIHWNGSSWARVPTPDGSNEVNWLIGAAPVATDDVWAVGYSATNPPESSVSNTLIEHWNGSSWTAVPSPNPNPPLSGGPVSNELRGVAAVAADDVWAVGQSFDYGASRTLVVHWDGTSWSPVTAPHPGRYSALRSISAVSANDIWAVGYQYVRGVQVTLVEHWDGTSWSVVASPNDGPFVQELHRVRAVSTNDVWAVGYHLAVFGVSQVYQTSIWHWNGTAWSVVPSPDVNQLNNYLFSVDGTSASDAWAVGFWDTGFELRTMIQHWDGVAWSIVESPNSSDYIDELLDVAALTGDDVWAVGQFTGFFTFETLTLHHTASCASSMHVSAITPSSSQSAVRARVTIVDEAGSPVAGATVRTRVTSPGAPPVTLTRTTNAAGVASVSVARSQPGTYTFEVTNVVKSGLAYAPGDNVETSDSITVT